MVNVVNIVASGDFGRELDLLRVTQDIEPHVQTAQYEPETFPGIQIRFEEGGPVVVLYSTGSYTILGAKSRDQLESAYKNTVSAFTKLGIKIDDMDSRPIVRNLVCKEDMGKEVDLNALIVALGYENIEYEPEQSPFVYYWPEELDCLITIPTNGKIAVTGIADIEEAEEAVRHLQAKFDHG